MHGVLWIIYIICAGGDPLRVCANDIRRVIIKTARSLFNIIADAGIALE